MTVDRRLAVLRVLDDQNKLGERADAKASYMLSTLGFFTAFFISYVRSIPPNPVTIILIVIFFLGAIAAILNIILAISPRIRLQGFPKTEPGKIDPNKAAFFGTICRFPSLSEYKQCLNEMLNDDSTLIDVYTRQIYEVSQITAQKYKHTTRAVFCVVSALLAEFSLIAYLFVSGTFKPV